MILESWRRSLLDRSACVMSMQAMLDIIGAVGEVEQNLAARCSQCLYHISIIEVATILVDEAGFLAGIFGKMVQHRCTDDRVLWLKLIASTQLLCRGDNRCVQWNDPRDREQSVERIAQALVLVTQTARQ